MGRYPGGMSGETAELWRFRGRSVTGADLAFIRQLMAAHPQASRRRLSALLCEAWNWRQLNGQLKDMLCRSFMLGLHRQGLIILPAKRKETINNVVARRTRSTHPTLPGTMPGLEMSLKELGPVEFVSVRRTPREGLFEQLLQAHHYLGYTQPVGEHRVLSARVREERKRR
jgi:hypothetical protein